MNYMEEIFEIIEDETCLSEDELLDEECVREDLLDIAEVNELIEEWVAYIGVDNAVHIVMERNKNPYNAVNEMLDLIVSLMKEQECMEEEFEKCVNSIYESYNVPLEYRKYTKEKE